MNNLEVTNSQFTINPSQVKNVPQIRFKGFEAEWGSNSLGELGQTQSGIGFPDAEQGGKTGTPFFKVSDMSRVGNDREMLTSNNYVSDVQLKRKKWTPISDVPAVIFAKVGAAIMLNRKRIVRRPFLIDNNVMAYIFDATWDTNFGKTLFDTINLPSYAQVGALPSYNGSDIESIVVHRPGNREEQTQIGKYFRELDSLIGLHQRKHDKLVTLKKSMLQKMFPQPGATTPEIRFKGFEEDWAMKKLYSLVDRYDNLRIPVTASNRIPGNTPYYGANGIQDYVSGFTHEGEFILVAEDGANDLKNYPVQYVSGKVWVNNHAHVIQGKVGLAETRFLKYAFAQINVEAFLVGGGRSKLNAETMMQLELCAPEGIKEQQKISNYFHTLDSLISKHATQLQKLQQLKSACLAKMFV
ncbi:MAG: hypothetical protein B7Y07_10295 [Halothiobacillus sp. 24-54-40]|jgi:type I restriction enzyme S subunit|nr:MAG: hypothetical protein B7Y58_08845 [Halothiobacillus sp. 35-54-62]OYZ85788.1 MAG: hypothetical protein B7Y07_10295 [Halothiobacillus sp. 24-54-40]OZB49116.1 MAG: hypothetical protein B7X60_02215 [Polynucleobacter sp. 39-45-136]HQS03600.1 restriction endonuclease subunit S [Halothiobacillus sp.]